MNWLPVRYASLAPFVNQMKKDGCIWLDFPNGAREALPIDGFAFGEPDWRNQLSKTIYVREDLIKMLGLGGFLAAEERRRPYGPDGKFLPSTWKGKDRRTKGRFRGRG